MQICIFTPKYMPPVPGGNFESGYPDDEKSMWNALAQVITELRNEHGDEVPVNMDFCFLTDTTNQLIIANAGVSELPAVQIFTRYPDGTNREYIITKDIDDKLFGVNWTPANVRPYLQNSLYQWAGGEQSLLCKFIPPLCELGMWSWLAATGFLAYKTFDSTGKSQKVVYGFGAALCAEAFYRKGGIDQLKEKFFKK